MAGPFTNAKLDVYRYLHVRPAPRPTLTVPTHTRLPASFSIHYPLHEAVYLKAFRLVPYVLLTLATLSTASFTCWLGDLCTFRLSVDVTEVVDS